jgi:MOSC domain-containing protein
MGSMPNAEAEARVTRLAVYPVKGLGGQLLEEVEVQDRGFAWDRRWMLVGEDHRFLTQRQLPRMATISASVTGDELVLTHRNSQITVPLKPPETAPKLQVTIWNDQVEALLLPEYGQWFSETLHHRCDLVFMPDTTLRAVNPVFARSGDIVGFADAYPILLVGAATLADLNARLDDPVPIDRFRPNIVVSSNEPFIEDRWGEIEIGSVVVCGTKASARCSVPTVDQLTGERTGPEPIRTLATYRRFGEGVYFGQNLTIRRMGRIALGDAVSIRSIIGAVYG